MQINQLILSLALPTAAKTIGAAVGAVQNAGESFVAALSGTPVEGTAVNNSRFEADSDATTAIDASDDAAASNSFADRLLSFADRLRGFLSARGVQDDFQVQLQVDSEGKSNAQIGGFNAEQVADVLASNPAWLQELKQLAADGQIESAGRRASARPPLLNIRITEGGTSHWAAA